MYLACYLIMLGGGGGGEERKDFMTTFLAWLNNNFHFSPSMTVVSCMLLNIANCLIAQDEAKEQKKNLWGGQDTMNRQFFCLFLSFVAFWRNCITLSSCFLNSVSEGLIFVDAQKWCVQVKKSVVTPDLEQSCLALYSAICLPTPLFYMRWTRDGSGRMCTNIILRPCCVYRWVWSDSLPALVEQ